MQAAYKGKGPKPKGFAHASWPLPGAWQSQVLKQALPTQGLQAGPRQMICPKRCPAPRRCQKEGAWTKSQRVQGFKALRVQGFKGSSFQGFKDSRVQGFKKLYIGKLQGSPKKAQGQDLALIPVKRAFFSIEISSVLAPGNFVFFYAYQTGFKGPRFQGSKGPRAQGSKGPRVPGFKGLKGSKSYILGSFRAAPKRPAPFWRLEILFFYACQKGFKGPRVQGSKGPRLQGFEGSRVQGFKGSRLQGSKGSRVQASRVQGFKDSRVQAFKLPSLQASRLPSLQASSIQASKPPSFSRPQASQASQASKPPSVA